MVLGQTTRRPSSRRRFASVDCTCMLRSKSCINSSLPALAHPRHAEVLAGEPLVAKVRQQLRRDARARVLAEVRHDRHRMLFLALLVNGRLDGVTSSR